MSTEPGHPKRAPQSLSQEIEALQVSELFGNLGVSAAAAYVGTLLCVAVFLDDGLRGPHIVWLAYGSLVAALRLGLAWLHHARGPALEPRLWAKLAVLGNVLAGIQWGLLGTWLFPEEPGYRQTFAIMVITCFVGGSITAYAPVRWAHPALAIPATVPPTVYIFFIESGPHPMAGFTALFFTAMVLYYAFRENELVARRLRADARNRRELRAIEDLAASCRAVPLLNENRGA
ncbi:MAG TPA: hypothetical protein VFV55_11605 [Usitatibacteraceae bacterium]|nr:hypothetical protein [Usitatibacteraceae bacterium]